eukprot:1158721-Pelagomonas_calceolata.AAC.2
MHAHAHTCPDSTECELLWNGGAPMQPMLLRAPLAGPPAVRASARPPWPCRSAAPASECRSQSPAQAVSAFRMITGDQDWQRLSFILYTSFGLQLAMYLLQQTFQRTHSQNACQLLHQVG